MLEPRGRGWLWEDPAWGLVDGPPDDLVAFLRPSDTRLWRMVALLRHGWADASAIAAASVAYIVLFFGSQPALATLAVLVLQFGASVYGWWAWRPAT